MEEEELRKIIGKIVSISDVRKTSPDVFVVELSFCSWPSGRDPYYSYLEQKIYEILLKHGYKLLTIETGNYLDGTPAPVILRIKKLKK